MNNMFRVINLNLSDFDDILQTVGAYVAGNIVFRTIRRLQHPEEKIREKNSIDVWVKAESLALLDIYLTDNDFTAVTVRFNNSHITRSEQYIRNIIYYSRREGQVIIKLFVYDAPDFNEIVNLVYTSFDAIYYNGLTIVYPNLDEYIEFIRRGFFRIDVRLNLDSWMGNSIYMIDVAALYATEYSIYDFHSIIQSLRYTFKFRENVEPYSDNDISNFVDKWNRLLGNTARLNYIPNDNVLILNSNVGSQIKIELVPNGRHNRATENIFFNLGITFEDVQDLHRENNLTTDMLNTFINSSFARINDPILDQIPVYLRFCYEWNEYVDETRTLGLLPLPIILITPNRIIVTYENGHNDENDRFVPATIVNVYNTNRNLDTEIKIGGNDVIPLTERADINSTVCYDFIESEETDLLANLRNPGSITFILPYAPYSLTCYNVTNLRKIFGIDRRSEERIRRWTSEGTRDVEGALIWHRDSNIFYQCENGLPMLNRVFFGLRLGGGLYLIPIIQILNAIVHAYTETNIFRLELRERLVNTGIISLGPATNWATPRSLGIWRDLFLDVDNNAIAAYHCQLSSYDVYNIIPVIPQNFIPQPAGGESVDEEDAKMAVDETWEKMRNIFKTLNTALESNVLSPDNLNIPDLVDFIRIMLEIFPTYKYTKENVYTADGKTIERVIPEDERTYRSPTYVRNTLAQILMQLTGRFTPPIPASNEQKTIENIRELYVRIQEELNKILQQGGLEVYPINQYPPDLGRNRDNVEVKQRETS
jgi:hypothetical protein